MPSDTLRERCIQCILNTKGLMHREATVNTSVNTDSGSGKLTVTIKGITAIDERSRELLAELIIKQARDNCPKKWYVSSITYATQAGDNVFSSECLSPNKTTNQSIIDSYGNIGEVPSEYCCPINGMIMDCPTRTIAGGPCCERSNLEFIIQCSSTAKDPFTRLSLHPCHFKTDYSLQREINQFVQQKEKDFLKIEEERIKRRYNNANSLEQALRRAAWKNHNDSTNEMIPPMILTH